MLPALIGELDEAKRISTRWIAKAAEKQIAHVHRDVRSLLKKRDVPDLDHLTDSRGYVAEYSLPLSEAMFLLSHYQGKRAEKARQFVIDAIDYFIASASKIRETEKLLERISWLEKDNQELAANQKRIALDAPKKRAPRRIHVPYLVATMHGLKFELRKRAKDECEEWQWNFGLIPWAAHALSTLEEMRDDAIDAAADSFLSKFRPSEFSDGVGALRDLLENLADDMCANPAKYTELETDDTTKEVNQ
jgi:hypothetical protein